MRRYLIRALKARVAHVWTGTDTLCRQASTGGLDVSGYLVVSKVPRALTVCHMCQGIIARQRGRAQTSGQSEAGSS